MENGLFDSQSSAHENEGKTGLFNFVDLSQSASQDSAPQHASKPWRAGFANLAAPIARQFDDSNPGVYIPGRSDSAAFSPSASVNPQPCSDNGQAFAPTTDHVIANSPFAPSSPGSVAIASELPPQSQGPNLSQLQPSFAAPENPAGGSANQVNDPSADWNSYAKTQMRNWQSQGGSPTMSQAGGQTGDSSGGPLRPARLDPAVSQAIDASFHLRTNQSGFMETGAIAGGATGLGTWLLDNHYKNTNPLDQSKEMGWWEKLSPMLRKENELRARVDGFTKINGVIANEVATHATKVSGSANEVLADWNKVNEQYMKGSRSDDSLTALNKQKDFVSKELSGIKNKKVLIDHFGTREQMLDGDVLFEKESQAAKLATKYREHMHAQEPAKAAAVKKELMEHIEESIKEQKKFPQLTKEALATLQKKAEFLNSISGKTKLDEELKNVVGTRAEVTAGTRLFETGTSEVTRLNTLAENLNAHRDLAQKLAKSTSNLNLAQSTLDAQIQKGAGSWFESTMRGASKGLLATGGCLLAGAALDKMMGHDAKFDAAHLISDGALIPATLLSGMPARVKIPLAATIFGVSRIGDFMNKKDAGAVDYNSIMRPNIVDALGATAAFMAPVPLPMKAALFAGVGVAGRAYNGLARAFNWDGANIAYLNDNADAAFGHDQEVRSADSFKNAVQKEKEMGAETDDAIWKKWTQWFDKENSTYPADFMRGTAVLFDSLGETRLGLGSRLDPNNHDMTNNRILKKYNIDFGGEATQDLRSSALELIKAREYVQSHQWNERGSQSDYVNQLQDLQTGIESKLESIYGSSHDIEGVFSELQCADSGLLSHAVARQLENIALSNTSDKRHVAKQARDIALGEMALASRRNGDSRLFDDALKNLSKSEELDPSAADNRPLRSLADHLNVAHN